jgi:mRNA-degrading endonuclease RelE of RelBE toxin-antitoxin system
VRAIRKLPPEAKRRIEDEVLTVVLVHAGHRREVYR